MALYISNYQEINNQIKVIAKIAFVLKLLNTNIHKVSVTSSVDYRSVAKILTVTATSWYSYEGKQTRPIKVMIKNFHSILHYTFFTPLFSLSLLGILNLNLFLNVKIARHLDIPGYSVAKCQNVLNAVVSTKASSAKNQFAKNQNAVTVAKDIRQTTGDALFPRSFKVFATKP